jgi:hypothetical protein
MDRPVFLIDHGGVKLYPDAPFTSEGSREYEHGVGQIQHQAIWSQRWAG